MHGRIDHVQKNHNICIYRDIYALNQQLTIMGQNRVLNLASIINGCLYWSIYVQSKEVFEILKISNLIYSKLLFWSYSPLTRNRRHHFDTHELYVYLINTLIHTKSPFRKLFSCHCLAQGTLYCTTSGLTHLGEY